MLTFAKAMPVSRVAAMTREHDTRIWRVLEHHVAAARDCADFSAVGQVGMDETSARKGQDYVSIFADLEAGRVLFATEGRSADTVARFAVDLTAHGGDPKHITDTSSDMSTAFIAGIGEHLPNATLTFDRYHLAAKLSEAVNQVRRTEVRTRPELKRTRWLWLKNWSNLSVTQRRELHQLMRPSAKLATARALRWREDFQAFYDQHPSHALPAEAVDVALAAPAFSPELVAAARTIDVRAVAVNQPTRASPHASERARRSTLRHSPSRVSHRTSMGSLDAQPVPFRQHDALLDRHRLVVEHSGAMLGSIHGPRISILGIALAGELVEQQALTFLNLPQPLVDAALGQQAVYLDLTDLPHPVSTGDRLPIRSGSSVSTSSWLRRRYTAATARRNARAPATASLASTRRATAGWRYPTSWRNSSTLFSIGIPVRNRIRWAFPAAAATIFDRCAPGFFT